MRRARHIMQVHPKNKTTNDIWYRFIRALKTLKTKKKTFDEIFLIFFNSTHNLYDNAVFNDKCHVSSSPSTITIIADVIQIKTLARTPCTSVYCFNSNAMFAYGA